MLSKLIIPIVGVRALTVSGTDAFKVPMHGCLSGEKNERASDDRMRNLARGSGVDPRQIGAK